jgi:hypothetical protein
MAKKSERVMDMVRREVQKNPGVKSGELYEEAKKLDRSISSLSLRQFHAQYPLQVKRAMKSGGGKTRKKAAKKTRRPAGAARKTAGRRRTATKKKTTKRTAAKKRGRPPGRKTKTTRTRRTGTAAVTRPRGRRASGASRAAAAAGDRGSVRAVLLEFAGEIANAENKADMISVIAGMDRWVDRVVRAAT